ncbi:hypothetical protein PIB30_063261 [Stylosanthes scabra]|uniref:Uncharacterized protein n=1 Tax=Stylosanthes scabra TaxID=79078 RepID=A0ABU6RLB4_9FABA|nr:hypothetical protein [Stylosanthes scabra]
MTASSESDIKIPPNMARSLQEMRSLPAELPAEFETDFSQLTIPNLFSALRSPHPHAHPHTHPSLSTATVSPNAAGECREAHRSACVTEPIVTPPHPIPTRMACQENPTLPHCEAKKRATTALFELHQGQEENRRKNKKPAMTPPKILDATKKKSEVTEDPQLCAPYASDIYNYLRKLELKEYLVMTMSSIMEHHGPTYCFSMFMFNCHGERSIGS